jgi:hypothetical protein
VTLRLAGIQRNPTSYEGATSITFSAATWAFTSRAANAGNDTQLSKQTSGTQVRGINVTEADLRIGIG